MAGEIPQARDVLEKVRASYNFVLAAPIIMTGIFDQDVTQQEAMADPRLYVSGREGPLLLGSYLRSLRSGPECHEVGAELIAPLKTFQTFQKVEMLLSAAVHSCVIGFVMLMVFHDMSILHTGDFYTFGTMAGPWCSYFTSLEVFTVLMISMNYRAAFVTRTWNWLTLLGQAFSFLIYAPLGPAFLGREDLRLFLLLYCDVPWMTEHFQPWMRGAGASR